MGKGGGRQPETWDRLYALNLKTALNACQAALPYLLESGAGRIVNVGAQSALKAASGMGPYAASKSAVHRLTESLAEELKLKGVTVNAVLPSIIDTPANRRDMPKAAFDHWVQPAELAAVMLFLASDEASAVTGALIPSRGVCNRQCPTAAQKSAAALLPPHTSGRSASRSMEEMVDEGDRHAAFADGRGHALDRAEPHVAAGEYARHAGLQQEGIALELPPPGLDHVVAGQHVAPRVAGDLGGQPIGFRVGADEDEEASAATSPHLLAHAVADVDRREMGAPWTALTLPNGAGPRR